MYDPFHTNPHVDPPTTFEERMEAGDAWIKRAIWALQAGYVDGSATAAGIATAWFASAAAVANPPAVERD